MKTLIVFNHPYDGSFCSAILAAALKGLAGSGQASDVIS
ncbi:MAG: NAD(P)H-dependent oxidoreductase [Bacteroidales bacterium]|nr:NAD(P)H-dependent oxidoreductase [Bacteroidales bacterium]